MCSVLSKLQMTDISRRYYERELGAGLGPSPSLKEHFGYPSPPNPSSPPSSLPPCVLERRWKRISADRISIVERVYDEEFDDVKTEAGEREVPFDNLGMIAAALHRTWEKLRLRGTEDLVFANRASNVLDAHNLLNRHIKPIAKKLGLPPTIDFRSFRTMHASLMRRTGARAEVTRDNMGHSDTGTTLNVYSETWWDERVDAVSRAVEAVFKEPAAKPSQSALSSRNATKQLAEWVPFWVPQLTAQLVGD